jgi:hypothetical protein
MLTDECGQPVVPNSFALTIGDASIEMVAVPPGLTAAEAQHRLETWEGLRDYADSSECRCRELVGGGVDNVITRTVCARCAALDAAELKGE